MTFRLPLALPARALELLIPDIGLPLIWFAQLIVPAR